jgi:hypothetical protein
MAEVIDLEESLLPELPDPCLLAVLQCCAANDQGSLCSAARAHSRLHQAAVLALRSITAVVTRQEQADSVLLYLSKHGQHLDSVSIENKGDEGSVSLSLSLHPAAAMQLRSWQSKNVVLAGDGLQRVLAPTLTHLRLEDLKLCGIATASALAATLSQLSRLEHLCFTGLCTNDPYCVFPTGVLQQPLTYLELAHAVIEGPDRDIPALQPLQALARLADLRLKL